MSLITLIQTHAAAALAVAAQSDQPADWSAVAAALNGATTEVTDSRPWIYATIGDRLGPEAQAAAVAYIRAGAVSDADLADAHQLLLVGDGKGAGLRLDLPDRQAKLTAMIAAAPTPEAAVLLTAIKNLGRSDVRYVDSAGLGTVTADQCREAWRLQERQQLLQELQQQFDSVKNQIGTAEQPLAVAALRAMANELEAG